MTGIELLSLIRHTYENPPPVVMMISAYGDDENRSLVLHGGANDFLTKPIDFTSSWFPCFKLIKIFGNTPQA